MAALQGILRKAACWSATLLDHAVSRVAWRAELLSKDAESVPLLTGHALASSRIRGWDQGRFGTRTKP